MLNINKLKKLQRKSGLEIADFCKKISITKSTWYNLLKSGDFRVVQLEKMSEIFEVPISSFFDDTGVPGNNLSITNGDNNKQIIINGKKTNAKALVEKIKGLEKEVKLLKEINELLKNK